MRPPRMGKLAVAIGVAIVAVVATGFAVVMYQNRPVRVDRDAFLPLPEGLKLVHTSEGGLQGAGPEIHPLYAVMSVPGATDVEEALSRIRRHLKSRGWHLQSVAGGWWTDRGLNESDMAATLGPLEGYLRAELPYATEGLVPDELAKAVKGNRDALVLVIFEPSA